MTDMLMNRVNKYEQIWVCLGCVAQTHQSGMSVQPIIEAILMTGLRATHTL